MKKAESCVFSDCPELKKVHLPMSLKEIEEEEFNSCPNVTIYAPGGFRDRSICKMVRDPVSGGVNF